MLTRTFLSSPMHEVHNTLSEWMQQADMTVRVDAIGNLIGRYPGVSEDALTLFIGSHLDTIPNAGKYDGILGVLMGLALVESLNGSRLPFAIEVIGFSEEEGVRFSTPYLGSLAVVGELTDAHLALRDKQGVSVAEAITRFGLDVEHLPDARYYPERVIGYVEVHIEQGPVLESLGLPVGVVNAIAGQSRLRIRIDGKAGHAGTVPMNQRQDALAGAAEFVGVVETYARDTEGLVATVGAFTVDPGAANVIPGSVALSLDVRHANDEVRETAVAAICKHGVEIAYQRGLHWTIQSETHHAAVPMDATLQSHLEAAITASGLPTHRLVSGAGHDAAILARMTPTSLLFVRSPGGISHHPDESVLEADVSAALDVMLRYLEQLSHTLA